MRKYNNKQRAFTNLEGKVFGVLTVIGRSRLIKRGARKSRDRYWPVACKCGVEKLARAECLLRNETVCCSRRCKYNSSFKGLDALSGTYWRSLKISAQRRGLTFSITMEYALSLLGRAGHACALSGKAIVLQRSAKDRAQGKQTASLDRIDSSKGYVEGNVQWVNKDINIMKRHHSDTDFIELCTSVAKHAKRLPRKA